MKAIPHLLSLELCERFEPLAKERGVSEVARSKRGFLTAYKHVGGDWNALDPWWQNRRNNFVKRHVAQMEMHGEPLWEADGTPTRRHLGLIMWAHSPVTAKVLEKHMARLNPKLSDCAFMYLETALWSSSDEDGEPLDRKYNVSDFSEEAREQAESDCAAFMERTDTSGLSDEDVGHNLWLTRNRHGTGFWDRDLGEQGKALTRAAHSMGEVDVYLGDDGQLHLTPTSRRNPEWAKKLGRAVGAPRRAKQRAQTALAAQREKAAKQAEESKAAWEAKKARARAYAAEVKEDFLKGMRSNPRGRH